MFGFGKRKKIEKLVEIIGNTFTGQTALMPITPDEFIEFAKVDELVSGYVMGFQMQIITNSPFSERDHQGILSDSYYNLFGDLDFADVLKFAYRNANNPTFKNGLTLGIRDIVNFGLDATNHPKGLLLILDGKAEELRVS
tara:strand:- start:515 stop:934 length:420 start_codon:yes stop_codon:yes gene_type:complete